MKTELKITIPHFGTRNSVIQSTIDIYFDHKFYKLICLKEIIQ